MKHRAAATGDTEFEIKLEIPPERLAAVREALGTKGAQRIAMQARYVDTADGRLARHGVALRLRREGGAWVQTCKAQGAGLARLEHNAPAGSGARDDQPPVVDLARHAGTPAGEALAAALGLDALQGDAGLVTTFESDVERLQRCLVHGDSEVEVALDRGELRAGTRVLALCEVEFELKDGRPADAVALARQWAARHGLWWSVASKAHKGRCLAEGATAGPAVQAGMPTPGRGLAGGAIASAVVAHALAQVVGNTSAIGAGTGGDAHVHQARVGLRRLRTALRALDGLAGPVEPAWETALVEAFRVLGQHRDRVHLGALVQAALAQAGGPPLDLAGIGQAPDVGAAVRQPAFQDALLGLLGWTLEAGSDTSVPPKAARKAVRKHLERLHRQVLRDGGQFLALDEALQHRTRKRLKRLRYLAEGVAPLFGARKARDYLAGLKPAQEALGTYNDELVALAGARARTQDQPAAWFAVGWLSARREANAREAARALHALEALKPFWH